MPGGWLHRCAVYKSSEILRAETRRRKHERAAAADPGLTAAGEADGSVVSGEVELPLAALEKAVAGLPEADREALRLRYYKGLSLRQVGWTLGLSEDTVQKRVSRALRRLRMDLVRRGVTGASVAGLTAAAGGAPIMACVPAGLVPALAATAAAGTPGPVAGGMTAFFFQVLAVMTTKTKFTLGVLGLCAVLAVPFCWQQQRIHLQRELISHLNSRLAGSAQPSSAIADSARRPGNGPPGAGTGAQGNAAGRVAGLEKILRDPDPLRRMGAFTAFLQEMTAEQAPAMFELMLELARTGVRVEEEGPMFLRRWGALDGPAALATAYRISSGGSEDKSIIMSGWAARDPQSAIAWLEAQTSGEYAGQKDLLAAGIAHGLSLNDPDAAARWIESRPPSEARNGMVDVLIRQYVTVRGLQGARNWFGTIAPNESNADYQQRAFDEIAKYLVKAGDMPQAVSWLDQHADQPYAATGGAAVKVLDTWARTDGAAAAEWAEAHPAVGGGGGPHTPLSAAVGAWAEKDPNAAGQWLGEKTGVPGYDQAAVAFSSAIVDQDPESAFAWAGTIQDPQLRKDRLFNIGVGWMARTSSPENKEALSATLKAHGVNLDIAFGKPKWTGLAPASSSAGN